MKLEVICQGTGKSSDWSLHIELLYQICVCQPPERDVKEKLSGVYWKHSMDTNVTAVSEIWPVRMPCLLSGSLTCEERVYGTER